MSQMKNGFIAFVISVSLQGTLASVADGQEALKTETTEPKSPKTEATETEIKEFVRNLGAAEFSVRQNASRRLLEIGVVAIPHLRPFQEHSNRELRLRANRLLDFLVHIELQQKVTQFYRLEDPSELNLPLWKEFDALFEGDKSARLLYGAFLREEIDFISAVADEENDFIDVLNRRISDMLTKLDQDKGQRKESVSAVSSCALLFCIQAKKVKLDNELQRFLVQAIRTENFYIELDRGMHRVAANRIFTESVVNNEEFSDIAVLVISFPQVLPRAKKIIEESDSSRLRERAMKAYHFWGTKKDLPFLESQFDSQTEVEVFRGQQDESKENAIPTTLGDLAFAAAVKIASFDKSKFNIDDEDPPFYTSKKQRIEGRKLWQEMKKQQADKKAKNKKTKSTAAPTEAIKE